MGALGQFNVSRVKSCCRTAFCWQGTRVGRITSAVMLLVILNACTEWGSNNESARFSAWLFVELQDDTYLASGEFNEAMSVVPFYIGSRDSMASCGRLVDFELNEASKRRSSWINREWSYLTIGRVKEPSEWVEVKIIGVDCMDDQINHHNLAVWKEI